jgi:hypothetical protein
MRAEKKVNESADTCHANRSCIHSRSTCCNGGSEGQREEVKSCRCYQGQSAPHTTCSYHVTHLANTELHREVETSQMETFQTQLAIVLRAQSVRFCPVSFSKGSSILEHPFEGRRKEAGSVSMFNYAQKMETGPAYLSKRDTGNYSVLPSKKTRGTTVTSNHQKESHRESDSVFYSVIRVLQTEWRFLRASARTLLSFHGLRVTIAYQILQDMYALKVLLRVLVQSTSTSETFRY